MDIIIENARLEGHQDDNHIIDDSHTERGEDKDNENNDSTSIYDAKGNFVCAGFYESHIHLDKACILDRCSIESGDLEEAVNETGQAKEEFSEADVYKRASKVIEMAIKKGTVGMRTFVETDAKTQLRSAVTASVDTRGGSSWWLPL